MRWDGKRKRQKDENYEERRNAGMVKRVMVYPRRKVNRERKKTGAEYECKKGKKNNNDESKRRGRRKSLPGDEWKGEKRKWR